MNIIHLDQAQFDIFPRKMIWEEFWEHIGVPLHYEDLEDKTGQFFGHLEAKEYSWCLN